MDKKELNKPGQGTQKPVKKSLWDEYKDQIEFRKFDSEDVVRIKGQSIIASTTENNDEKVRIDMGMLQKYSIIHGLKVCPWFSDRIDDNVGLTKASYNRRNLEFRRIPVELLDKLFKKVQEFNKYDTDLKKLSKN